MKRYSFGYKCYPSESDDDDWCKAKEAQAELATKSENFI